MSLQAIQSNTLGVSIIPEKGTKDAVGEELKRLIAFTGLKIINVEIGDYDLVIWCKFRRKKFKLQVINNEIHLFDSRGIEINRLSSKYPVPNFSYPNTIPSTYPYATTTNSTYFTYSTESDWVTNCYSYK